MDCRVRAASTAVLIFAIAALPARAVGQPIGFDTNGGDATVEIDLPDGLRYIAVPPLSEFYGLDVSTIDWGNSVIQHRLTDYSPTSRSYIDKAYVYFLENAVIPFVTPTPEEVARLEDARSVLIRKECLGSRMLDWIFRRPPPAQEPSKEYLKYFEYSHQVAVLADRIARAEDPEARRVILEERESLLARWERYGGKSTVESAIATYRELQQRDPVTIMGKLKARFRSASSGSLFPRSELSPKPSTWKDNQSWQPAKTGDAAYKIVAIVRPWMDYAEMLAAPWYWRGESPFGNSFLLSDGSGVPPDINNDRHIPTLSLNVVLRRTVRDNHVDQGQVVVVGYFYSLVPRLPRY